MSLFYLSIIIISLHISLLSKEKDYTVFENHRKSLIQHCEQSELCLHFKWSKVHQKYPKWSILASFWKPEAVGQTALPDTRQVNYNWTKNWGEMPKFKCDFWGDFQTLCTMHLFLFLSKIARQKVDS